ESIGSISIGVGMGWCKKDFSIAENGAKHRWHLGFIAVLPVEIPIEGINLTLHSLSKSCFLAYAIIHTLRENNMKNDRNPDLCRSFRCARLAHFVSSFLFISLEGSHANWVISQPMVEDEILAAWRGVLGLAIG